MACQASVNRWKDGTCGQQAMPLSCTPFSRYVPAGYEAEGGEEAYLRLRLPVSVNAAIFTYNYKGAEGQSDKLRYAVPTFQSLLATIRDRFGLHYSFHP